MHPYQYYSGHDDGMPSSSSWSTNSGGASYGNNPSSSWSGVSQSGQTYGQGFANPASGYQGATGVATSTLGPARVSHYQITGSASGSSYGQAPVNSHGTYLSASGQSSFGSAMAGDNQAGASMASQGPAQDVPPLPLSVLQTTVLVVPESLHLSARESASGEDRTYFKLHLLVPAVRNSEEVHWTKDLIQHEIKEVMLVPANVRDFLFNAQGARSSVSRATEVGDTRESSAPRQSASSNPASPERYILWSNFHIHHWEDKFDLIRVGYNGNRTIALTMDLHMTSKPVAAATIDEYSRQGGVVYTQVLRASQQWTQERSRSSRHGWKNLRRAEAHLSISAGSGEVKGQHTPPQPESWGDLRAECHDPTLVVVKHWSKTQYSALADYHMILSHKRRTTLDAHIRQRSIVVAKLRRSMNDPGLYLEAHQPKDYLAELMRNASTKHASIELTSPHAAERHLAETGTQCIDDRLQITANHSRTSIDMSAEASSSTAPSKKSKKGSKAAEQNGADDVEEIVNKNKRHRKDKPWDTDDIDHWKIEPMTQPSADAHQTFLEESSFALLFPKYREPYLRSVWGQITSALDAYGLACELDLVQGKMTVKTTRKTWDPYIVFKGRDLLKLLARGVSAPQALKVLQDDIACDVIKIGGLVRNKERFVKRRQRIVGPNGSTLKAIELLTECYVMVQGNTVSAMGTFKGLKEVRRIIIDCMNNIHPIYRIKELMIRRELAKDPKLAGESWDRFLPKFQKRHLKTSEKTARKNAAVERKEAARAEVQPNPNAIPIAADASAAPPPAKKKKVYTPFPPAPVQSKLDQQMATGEYFLKPREKEAIERRKREDRQHETAEKRKVEREEAFIAPPEAAAPSVAEKKKRKRTEDAA